jgi:hypothetical protein
MKRVFYSIAIVLAVIWIMSFFLFGAGGPIHALAFLSGICVVHGTIATPQKKYMLGNRKLSEQEADSAELSGSDINL